MSSHTEENKALVRRFFTAIESGDFQVFDEIVAQDYDDHLAGQSPGGETLKQYFAGLRSSFPDLRLPILAIVAEDDRVAVLNAVRGTHQGDFAGLKATGRTIDAMAFQLYRIKNAQLAEHWEVADFGSIYGDIHAAPRLRLFVQLTSDIEAGRNGGPRPVTDESKLFFEQGFADITMSKADHDSVVLRLGRQEFQLGAGRLVHVGEGPNVRRTFDGASLKWKTTSWNIDGFVAKPVLNRTGVLDAPPDHGSTFWGISAVHPLPKTKGGNVDLYYLGIAIKSIPLRPQVGATALVASGDHGNSRSKLGTLNSLFPTGFYFGQGGIGLSGPANLMAVGPHVGLQLTTSLTVIVDNNVFWRTSLQDGIYGLGGNLLVSGRGNSCPFGGPA